MIGVDKLRDMVVTEAVEGGTNNHFLMNPEHLDQDILNPRGMQD